MILKNIKGICARKLPHGGGEKRDQPHIQKLKNKMNHDKFCFYCRQKFYFRYWRRGGVNLEIPFPPELSISISEHSCSNILMLKLFEEKADFFLSFCPLCIEEAEITATFKKREYSTLMNFFT